MSPSTFEPIFDYAEGVPHGSELYHYDSIAEGIRGFAAVDAEQVRNYETTGFLVIHDAFTPAEVESARRGLTDLITGANPDYTGLMFESDAKDDPRIYAPEQRLDLVRKLMSFTQYDARLRAVAEHPKLLDIVGRLLGDRPRLFQDMALLKPPHIGREKPWHQDHAYFDFPIGTRIVGVWIALDEATPENGCMHVLSGAHRDGPVVHFNKRDWQICDTDILGKRCVAVPLRPGGLLLFDALLPHGTPLNESDKRRWAVQFHYVPESAVQTSVAERMAIFGAEGKDVTC